MMKTKITELFSIRYPILQGGMAWIADGTLAAAVSEGGCGGGDRRDPRTAKRHSTADRPSGDSRSCLRS